MSTGCNFLEVNGYCYRHEGALTCHGTDTCPDWALVYATQEVAAQLRALNKIQGSE